MLTGKRPFNARTLAGYVQKHLTTEPTPPSTHVAMIPKDLETACLRLLQKSPDDRFASCQPSVAIHILIHSDYSR